MRPHRFFVKEPLENKGSFFITDRELLNQWKNVFRFQIGHRLILLDNSSYEFLAQIVLLTNLKAEVEIISSKISETVPRADLTLFMALIKKDNFEWVLEKGTEIGVTHFVPLLAEKSEKKNFNEERGLKIIQEATEQSQRALLPTLGGMVKTIEALNICKEQGIESILVLDPEGNTKFDKDFLKSVNREIQKAKIALFIGPEGGWSKQELEFFTKNGAQICTFGTAILRAETAAVAATSILLLS